MHSPLMSLYRFLHGLQKPLLASATWGSTHESSHVFRSRAHPIFSISTSLPCDMRVATDTSLLV
jgi:hypothetical protein